MKSNYEQEGILTLEILNKIQGNEDFKAVFIESAKNEILVKEFNRLRGTSLNFNADKKTTGIEALIDQATGFDGIIAKDQDMKLFVDFVYRSIYYPLTTNKP